MQKHKLYNPHGLLAKPMRLNMQKIRNLALILSLLIVIPAFAWVALNTQQVPSGNEDGTFFLPTVNDEQNGLIIQVESLPFAFGEEVKFKLTLDTNSGDLNFDLTVVATLEDNN